MMARGRAMPIVLFFLNLETKGMNLVPILKPKLVILGFVLLISGHCAGLLVKIPL